MSVFVFNDNEALGHVRSVDTATVVAEVSDIERLRQLQVNRLAVLRSSRPGQHLVGVIQKITRTTSESIKRMESHDAGDNEETSSELNLVRIALIGTMIDHIGSRHDVFTRTLESVPEIDASCFALEGDHLTKFMRVVSNVPESVSPLSLGHYTIDEKAEAFLNGNKLFQRHAIIVGSTGSGKSWATARMLEQIASLPNASAIVFDIHGEYGTLVGAGFRHFRVAGPADLEKKTGLKDGVLYLPYWLLDYEAMISMFVDRSDQNAPNQAMVMSRAVVAEKRSYLESGKHKDVLENFTIDSPIPFDLGKVLAEIERLNKEMVQGAKATTEKQGEYFGRLSRLIQRLENKRLDRRLGFLFRGGDETLDFAWLSLVASALVAGTKDQADQTGGVKVIDFSDVPSEVLPLIVSLVAKLAFSIRQWTATNQRHPIALFCDEAHLYIPERSAAGSAGEVSVEIFERIAKEGRKYGVGLVVISQRPSEVNHTVLSQCNNLVALRLTNGEDQSVVRRLLPDSLGGFGDLLPILDTGEALVVGDASLLPSRIRISMPQHQPSSGTINFWDCWANDVKVGGVDEAVDGWRKQSMQGVR